MTIIKPTIGRKVWFWPNGSHIGVPGAAQPQSQAPAQAMDATVVLVHGDRMVNLLVLDHDGCAWPVRSVPLQQEGDATPHGMYAQWMPYQVGQAKKEAPAPETPALTGLGFGDALGWLQANDRMARAGWNGKGMWLKLIKPCDYDVACGAVGYSSAAPESNLELLPWIGMKTADGKFVPWLASQTDLLAQDWTVVG